jgi:sulfofructosephosphate aldolase
MDAEAGRTVIDRSPTGLATPDLHALARPDGTFAMLAIDQRESLRTLLAAARHAAADADLTRFKVAVARTLSPFASGLLIDRDYGLDAVARDGAVADGCGLIVAVDRLIQEPGGPLQGSELDRSALTEDLRAKGASALKFLVVWRPDESPDGRAAMVGDFVDGCRRLGLLSVLEGLVQVPGASGGPDHDAAILAAAREFAPFGPDLYKTHVPTLGEGEPGEIEERSRAVTAALPCPWVVLSAGVKVDRVPDAVAAAGRGGASGFLAGRGVWGPSIQTADPEADLAGAAVRRLTDLGSIAARHARPWSA